LAIRLEELEKKFRKHDSRIREVFQALRALLAAAPAKGSFGYPVQASQQK
jgi:hypothetical protein